MSRALSAADSSAALSTGAPAKATSALFHPPYRIIQLTSHIMQAIAGMNARFQHHNRYREGSQLNCSNEKKLTEGPELYRLQWTSYSMLVSDAAKTNLVVNF